MKSSVNMSGLDMHVITIPICGNLEHIHLVMQVEYSVFQISVHCTQCNKCVESI